MHLLDDICPQNGGGNSFVACVHYTGFLTALCSCEESLLKYRKMCSPLILYPPLLLCSKDFKHLTGSDLHQLFFLSDESLKRKKNLKAGRP